MKNKYFLVETDSELTCADILATFTNKKEAIKACAEKRMARKAANGLRLSEGSREGYSGGFQKVPKKAIIY